MSKGEKGEQDTDRETFPERVKDDIIAVAADVTLVVDASGVVQAVADDGASTLGYSAGDLTGRQVGSLVATDARPTGQFDATTGTELEALLLADETRDATVPIRTADGRVAAVSFSTVSHPDRQGWVCVGQEVNDSLRTDNRPVDGAFDAVADPVFVLDDTGEIAQVNDAFVAYTGYNRTELVGRPIVELMPAGAHDHARSTFRELTGAPEETTTVETALTTEDGSLILTEANVTAQTDDDGTYAGAVGVLRDISERKYRERTLNMLKQVLTRVFRHNVRNKLMIAQSHTKLLEDSIDDDLHTHTDKILDATKQLVDHSEKARRIRQVIDTDEQVELDLTTSVGSVVETARQNYRAASIDTDLPASLTVTAHPRIASAIEELVTNAVEHADDESAAHVEVWVDRQQDTQTLFIEDESGGLDDTEVDVLERGTETDLEHGSGVGLWLVRWLVEFSDAELIVHRTADGSLIGIRFDPQAGGGTAVAPVDSPFVDTPAHVQNISPEQFRGDTVIGRIEALNRLNDAYDGLERAGGHSVLVTGEAGIGKSTLVEQFQADVSTRDPSTVVAAGFCASGAQPAYNAFRQVLSDLPGEREFTDLLDLPPEDDPDETEQRRQELFTAIAERLRDVATDEPTVVVVEDLQWADRDTVALFEYLVEEIGRWGYPVMFIGTYRTSEVNESHPVLDIAQETAAAGRGTVVELETFGQAEVESLLSHMLAVDAVPAGFTEAVLEQTGGTPLFVNELGRHLVNTLGPIQTGSDLPVSLDGVDVPETVESAIADRLDSLPAEVWPVLRLGAVIGQEFTFDLLRAASEYSTDELIEFSNTLQRRDIWTHSADEVAFAHGLLREQVLDRLGDDERASHHAAVAEAVETVYSDDLDEFAGQLGSHYEQAGEYTQAVEYYRRAGDHAADSYANEDAIDRYEQARQLLTEHGADDRETHAAILDSLVDVHMLRGEYDRVEEYCEESLRLYAELEDRQGKARSLKKLGEVALNRGAYDQAQEYYTDCLAIYRAIGDRDGEADALGSLGRTAYYRGNVSQAEDQLEQSVAIKRETGDREGKAALLDNLGSIVMGRGAFDRAAKHLERSLNIRQELGDRQGESNCLSNLGLLEKRRGEYEQAGEYWQRALELRREIGDRGGKASVLRSLGMLALDRGSYDQARAHLEESLDIYEEIGDRQNRAVTLGNLGTLALQRGAYDRAHSFHEQSLTIYQEIGDRRGEAYSRRYLGQVARHRKRHERATALLTAALEVARETDAAALEIETLRELGAVARETGAYDQATQHLTDALDACDANDLPREHAETALERARLAVARDEGETAREFVDAASATFTELDDTHNEARATLIRGRIAVLAESPGEARTYWQQALETLRDIGAPQDALRVLELLVETCQRQGDDEQAAEYRSTAEQTYENAPEAVQTHYGDWLRD